jgi:hypothetical protein
MQRSTVVLNGGPIMAVCFKRFKLLLLTSPPLLVDFLKVFNQGSRPHGGTDFPAVSTFSDDENDGQAFP